MTYRLQKLGVIQRIELPAIITKTGIAVEMSTVDYIGHYKGYPVAFDAKESKEQRVNFARLSQHQVTFLKYWAQSAKLNQPKILSGFFIYFYEHNKDELYFYEIEDHLQNIELGKKSISMDDLHDRFSINDSLLESYFFR